MMDCVQGRALVLLFLSSSLLISCGALPFVGNEGVPDYASKVVSEAADAIVQKVGWSKDSWKISSVDMTDAKLGETVTYEFDIEIGGVIFPIIFKEDISAWRFLEDVDFGKEEGTGKAIDVWQPEYTPATLKPFQLAGPVDLWIQDADKMRLAMPNDVDAGVLKRVLIADGAVVTVEGAREVSLARPLKLPLPLFRNAENDGLASSLLNLASRLRLASTAQQQHLSLRIVGPNTLVAATLESSESAKAGLKVKRLSPSSVELVSRNEIAPLEPLGNPTAVPWLWPLVSINASTRAVLDLERALFAFLGPKAHKEGSVNLLKAKVKVSSFVKIAFEMESEMTNETLDLIQWPEWATKPSVSRVQFEVLAKVEGGKLRPVSVNQVQPGAFPTVTESFQEMVGNMTYGNVMPFLGVTNPITLDVDWGDL